MSAKGSYWKDASKAWLKKICGHAPQRGEVTPEAMMAILRNRNIPLSLVTLLGLCWCTTGRPTNWHWVKKEQLLITKETFEEKQKEAQQGAPVTHQELGYKVRITWIDHKTQGKRDPFTTHSWLPTEVGVKVLDWVNQVRGEWVFPKALWKELDDGTARVLKEHNAEWDLKSLRRGSLSTMARNGTPLEDLLLFSGHTSKATLLRYLGWGVHAKEHAVRGEAAAKGLLPWR